jgi:uncharacterized protein YbcC (UPF0753/DUF2309 family)
MGVIRNISFIVYTELNTSYQLINEVLSLWMDKDNFKIKSFYLDDTDNDDISESMNFNEVEEILTLRDSKMLINTITVFINQIDESFIINSQLLENNFNDEKKYKLAFSPSGKYTLSNFERHTDFSFYLNILLPQLEKIGATATEINCEDFG